MFKLTPRKQVNPLEDIARDLDSAQICGGVWQRDRWSTGGACRCSLQTTFDHGRLTLMVGAIS